MADWKAYAKAARRTAQKQGPELREAAQTQSEQWRRGTERRASEYRRTAVAAGKVAGRRSRENDLLARMKAAVRDIVLIAFSLVVFYLVIAMLGVPLPVGWFLAGLVVLIAIRLVWALVRSGRGGGDRGADDRGGTRTADDAA